MLELEGASIAVGIGNLVAAAGQRSVAFLGFVADKSEDAAGFAVKPAPEAHDLMLFGGGAGKAQGGFDRFGSSAEQMGAVEAVRSDLGDEAEGLGAFLCGEGAYGQATGLLGDGAGEAGMGVAEAGHRDSGIEVDIGIAVGIRERAAFSVVKGDSGEERDALAPGSDEFLFLGEDPA